MRLLKGEDERPKMTKLSVNDYFATNNSTYMHFLQASRVIPLAKG